jgi:STE24 endopeptidase
MIYWRWYAAFNKLAPTTRRAAERIEQLLSRTIRSRGLYVMDGSKRSSHGNAFSPASRREAHRAFDTLVRLQPAEGSGAHELGHHKLGHIVAAWR